MTENPFKHGHGGSFAYIKNGDGSLLYSTSENLYCLDFIYSKKEGNGSKLIQEFVKTVGDNKNIFVSCITESRTLFYLEQIGAMEYVEKLNKSLIIDDEELLNRIKIVRLLKAGGITVNNIKICFNSEAKLSISLEGTT
ncbi:hypothetical protein KW795_02595 [Candidatus Microgenomates bacterium]|nr:hypothetical protein [Candidatus Microgenomates bacterium]